MNFINDGVFCLHAPSMGRRPFPSRPWSVPCVSAGLPGLVASMLHIPRDVPPDLACRASLLETHLASSGPAFSRRAPPSGFFKDRLSVDVRLGVHSHTSCDVFRPDAATRPTCSAFVGSHHLDGFLHRVVRRLVASCCRPWGSSGCCPRPRFRGSGLSHRCTSLQSLSLPSSRALRRRRPLPPRRHRLRYRPDLEALLHS